MLTVGHIDSVQFWTMLLLFLESHKSNVPSFEFTCVICYKFIVKFVDMMVNNYCTAEIVVSYYFLKASVL